jgi:hypothetical protein
MAPRLDSKQVNDLLYELCVQLGFCIPPDDAMRLAESPPEDVRSFVDAVIAAEGLDPATYDRRIYRKVRDMVAEVFQAAADEHPDSP